MDFGIEVALLLLLLALFSAVSFYKKTISNTGILVGNIVGLVVFFLGGLQSFVALAALFAVAEITTFYSRLKLKEKHEQRTTSNIIGNSGAALIVLLLGFQQAFFGAIAAALADTTAGEIGMLSKKKPRLITTLRRVETGTDGAITLLVLITGFFGGLAIGSIYLFFSGDIKGFAFITVAGIVGNVVDSLIGAVFERRKLLNNSQVNFLAGLSGAITVLVLSAM